MNEEPNQSSYIYIAEEGSATKTNQNNDKPSVQKTHQQQTFRAIKSLDLTTKQRANQHQILDRLKKLNQIKQVQQKQKQKVKMRRYDYLNKYNMNQMTELIHKNQQKIRQIKQNQGEKHFFPQNNQEKQKRLKRFIGESFDHKSAKNGQIYFSKQNTRRNSFDKQISSSLKKRRNKSPPYFAYLQAYQNNVKQCLDFHFPQQIMVNQSAHFSQITQPLVTLGQTHDSATISNLLSRVPSFSNSLNKQISYQNEILRGQTNQYKAIVSKLQLDLKTTRDELIITKQSLLKQRKQYEKIIGSLQQTNRILQSYKQKYEKLNKQLLQINLSEMKIKMVDSYFENKQNLESCNKLKVKAKCQQKAMNKQHQQSLNIYAQFLQRLQQLLNKNSGKNANNYGNLQGNPHNKIEQIMDKVEKVLSKHKRYEQFVYNIVEMYKKIQKTNKNIDVSYNQLSKTLQYGEPSLKQIWKWLKQLGYTYNLVQQIKPLMLKKLGIDESQNRDLKAILQNIILKA